MNKTPFARTLNIAHRGACSLAPENTLAAARKAYQIGADLWELDVCLTRDGEMNLLHDDTLERTSNAAEVYPERAPWNVTDFTMEEIRKLDFGSWFNLKDPFNQIALGNVSESEQYCYQGEPSPTLREALQFTKEHQWKVNVEIKDLLGTVGHDVIVERVVELICEMRMQKEVLISSFNHDYLARVKELAAEIKTGVLVENADPNPLMLVSRLNAQAYNPKFGCVTPEEIHRLREHGIDVFIYTVNDPREMKYLIDAQASGIFTDFPQTLKDILSMK
jgi:glycerophosphoryl diester phosphodiesterase